LTRLIRTLAFPAICLFLADHACDGKNLLNTMSSTITEYGYSLTYRKLACCFWALMCDWSLGLMNDSTLLVLAAAKHRCYAVSVGPE
jgi:hypothetical protein